MIIAIYGVACVGKTTVATGLGERLGCPVRHCGEAVKRHCQVVGVSPDLLSENGHATIDSETKAAVTGAQGDFIVEGSFLDAVLAGCSAVKFVRLICSDDQRVQRFTSRGGNGVQAFRARNEADGALKLRLYGRNPALASPDFTADTTTGSPTQIVDVIAEWLKTVE